MMKELSQRYTALIVDDDPDIREFVSESLKGLGIDVDGAGDGGEALDMVKENRYDLIFTDLEMPRMGGLEFIKNSVTLRDDSKVIVMTGYGTPESAVTSLKMGVFDYIHKPVRSNELKVIANKALEQIKAERENIRLKETVSLYRISQAMDTLLDLDEIMKVILEAARRELAPDIIALIPSDERQIYISGPDPDKEMRFRRFFEGLDIGNILDSIRSAGYLLVHDPEILKYFPLSPPDLIHSLLAVPLLVGNRGWGALITLSLNYHKRFSPAHSKILSIIASRAAMAIENERLYKRVKDTMWQTIESLTYALEAKDLYTHGHSLKVREYTDMICSGLNLDPSGAGGICQAALLHDIGKIGIKLEFLNKAEPLSEEEYEVFKSHLKIGREILEPIGFLKDIIPIIYHHHERFDGNGYPSKLKGDEIPFGARILALADAYDAMTTDRAYREALSREESIGQLRDNAGTQFDPEITRVFIECLERREE